MKYMSGGRRTREEIERDKKEKEYAKFMKAFDKRETNRQKMIDKFMKLYKTGEYYDVIKSNIDEGIYKPYCGYSSKIPFGHKRGTAKECAKLKQVRYWGKTAIPADDMRKRVDIREATKKALMNFKKKQADVAVAIRKMKSAKKIMDNVDDKYKPREVKKATTELERIRKRSPKLKTAIVKAREHYQSIKKLLDEGIDEMFEDDFNNAIVQ